MTTGHHFYVWKHNI